MKQIIFTLFLSLGFVLSYGQLKMHATGDATFGDNGTTPEEKVDVIGNLKVRGSDVFIGKNAGSTAARVEIGNERTSNGNAYFDLIGDASAYPDFGGRLIRFGANGLTAFTHRGLANLEFRTNDAASLVLVTNGTEKMRIRPTGNVGIGTGLPTAKLSVNGTADKPGGGEWGMFSDKRLKQDISPFKDGIEVLMELNPVTYHYNGKYSALGSPDVQHVGIIAQELQEVAPYMVDNKELVELVKEGRDETYREHQRSSNSYLHVDASAIKYILVNAVKEQQKLLVEKEERIKDLENKFEELERRMEGLESSNANISERLNKGSISLTKFDVAELDQNNPNPFSGSTTITYVIPSNSVAASINIYSIEGHLIKSVNLDHIGKGQLTVNAFDFPTGIYTYDLVIDNVKVETKKMVLTR
ncbi:MAG: tail fiber domain-containing protein [Saprospiraceae bacterium]|nr:tail fiber domain-containing protein [Saprospiraceae bacterium]